MAKQDKTKQITAYILEQERKADQYKKDIESGSQIASLYIKQAVARSRNDEKRKDIYFSVEAVKRVFEFFYFIRIKSGSGYTRFNLSPFQCWILSEIFGWYYTTGARRFRYAIIYTARKSGKTVFTVGIELYMLIYDREEDAEAYLCATTREQAGQALRYTKNIIKNSPALKKRLKVQQFQIIYSKRSGILKVLANKPEANDSLNPYVYVIDEMHAHRTLDFLNVMKSGTMSRDNPLGLITSTAGFNKEYPFFQMVETAKRTLAGVIDDDITFIALYTLDEEDPADAPENWIKSNPNIGQTIRIEALKSEWEKSKLSISEKNNFITKNLNRYLDNAEQWIPDEQIKTCFKNLSIPPGRVNAFAGIDLSSTRDLAALVIVWIDPVTGKMGVIPEFYFPANEIKRVRASGIDLGEWIERGFIFQHESPTIDHTLIFERVAYYHSLFNIIDIFYDKWNSAFIVPEIENKLYINCKHFEQRTTHFNFPLKYIERLVFNQEISFSTNPVLRWMLSNVVLYYDGNGNIKIMKNNSKDSVDGPVALAMAVAAWLASNNDTTAEFFRELIGANAPKT